MIDYTRQEAARPDSLADVQHCISVALDACNELARVCAAGVLSQQETQAEADKLRNAFETASDSRTLWKTRALAAEGTSEADDRYVTGTTFTGEAPVEGNPWRPTGSLTQTVVAALELAWRGQPVDIGRIREGLMAYLADWAGKIREDANEVTAAKLRKEHQPNRGSDVEAWIKAAREGYRRDDGSKLYTWHALDDLLNDYRDHADTGTPLDHPVQGPHPER